MRSHKIVAVAAAVGRRCAVLVSQYRRPGAGPGRRGAAPLPRHPRHVCLTARLTSAGTAKKAYGTSRTSRTWAPALSILATGKPFPVVKDVGPAANRRRARRRTSGALRSVPPWAAAMQLQHAQLVQVRSRGLLPASWWTASVRHAVPGRDPPDAGQVAHLPGLRGRRPHLA